MRDALNVLLAVGIIGVAWLPRLSRDLIEWPARRRLDREIALLQKLNAIAHDAIERIQEKDDLPK